jgi:putative transposase
MEKEEKRHPSDLMDGEWAILEPLIPSPKPGGHPRTVKIREVVNGIFYVPWGGSPGGSSPRNFRPGRRCTTTSGSGVKKACWKG